MGLHGLSAAVAALILVLGGVASAALADDDAAPCEISLERAPSDAPRFEQYPAPATEIAKSAPVDLRGNSEARRFRTMLRESAASGPDFAGHYTIAEWGCGTSCVNWAIVDALTGKVYFDRDAQVIAVDHVAIADNDIAALRYRRDSRLLILLGAPHEDEKRDGITYMLWDGHALKRLRFVPYSSLCGK
jgi:hypothetical protein